MSKRRKGFPSEARVKRGPQTIRDGEVELVERLGNNDLCPCAPRGASRTAVATPAAFDGAGRAYYERER
jgi:hypothetical protein